MEELEFVQNALQGFENQTRIKGKWKPTLTNKWPACWISILQNSTTIHG